MFGVDYVRPDLSPSYLRELNQRIEQQRLNDAVDVCRLEKGKTRDVKQCELIHAKEMLGKGYFKFIGKLERWSKAWNNGDQSEEANKAFCESLTGEEVTQWLENYTKQQTLNKEALSNFLSTMPSDGDCRNSNSRYQFCTGFHDGFRLSGKYKGYNLNGIIDGDTYTWAGKNAWGDSAAWTYRDVGSKCIDSLMRQTQSPVLTKLTDLDITELDVSRMCAGFFENGAFI